MRNTIVVKIGGSTLGSHDTALADVAALHASGERMVLVHGGGSAATEWLKIHGVASQFVDGLRVTGADSLDVVVAVFAGLVNKQIVSELRKHGAPAFGLSGVDGGLMPTKQMDERLGFVGEVTAVDAKPLDALIDAGYLPVVSSVGFWDADVSQLMNVNADTVAGEVAAAVQARDLVFMTDVAYVRGADNQAVPVLHPAEIEPLIASGVASGGMIPKLRSGSRAAGEGVICHIVDGREAGALPKALDGAELGTKVVAGS